jgi:hypothetical protein
MATVIRIHPTTPPKIDAIRARRPAWSLQTVIDEAMNALAQREGIDLTTPQVRRRSMNGKRSICH